ncbi:MAG: LCP family protein, partial [Actinobacteria bacterium]|nr:LCP family protein [Actinomycetota bacterium]
MRTTLKRGMGRGAAVNGDLRPVLPPGALSPVTVYRQPEPARRGTLGTIRRLVLWLLLGALMAATAAAGGVYLFFHQSVAAVVAHTPDVELAQKRLDVALPGQPATALVIGYDHRADEVRSTPSRSDTIMLIRADPRSKAISMLSFPRDLLVDVQCPD